MRELLNDSNYAEHPLTLWDYSRGCQTDGFCPVPAGMDDGATVRLSGEAGLIIHDIRTGILSDRTKLSGLQDYVRDVVRECRRETVE